MRNIIEQIHTLLGSFNMLTRTVFQIYKRDYVSPSILCEN